MKIRTIMLSLAAIMAVISCSSNSVKSPDGSIKFGLEESEGPFPVYYVEKDGDRIIDKAALGFALKDAKDFGKMKIAGARKSSHNETWEQPWGESRYVVNNYNEICIRLEEESGESRAIDLRIRVFDEGFGFRYEFPEQKSLKKFAIADEKTEFRFADSGHKIWWISRKNPYYEGYGKKTCIADIDTAYTPVTIEGADGRFYAIHEAALIDYAKMNLIPSDENTLKAELTPWSDGTKVYAETPFHTPWRTMTIGESVGDLTESHIMLNLNEPSEIEDTSWIKPGKYIGIWWVLHKDEYTWYSGPRHGANTELTKHYIDFASENGFAGVLVEGWNKGWDGNWMKNSTGFSFTEAYPDYDFEEIMEYARSKGVQMIIHNETAANIDHYFKTIDQAYSLYSSHGMHYIKTGNVNLLIDGKEEHDGQYGVNRLHSIVKKAAEYHICVDEHEPAMPTGVGRTWPNLMTHEAVRGQEHDAWELDGGNIPEHTVIIPYIRGLAGPMDFTFGTFDFSNPKYPFCRVQTTLAKQLALYVTIYSPLQMASDAPESYEGKKAFDFIRDVPADWHESHVPDAVIGDYSVTVRRDRNSMDWYLGAITDENKRTVEVKLNFLSPETEYLAQIYADGKDADWEKNPTSFAYSERKVTSKDSLKLELAAGGGCAIRFIPQAD